MPADFTGPTGPGSTLKRCPPFVTAMIAGDIIRAPADSTLILSETGEFSATGKSVNYLSTHFKEQVAGWPLGNVRVVKFINLWIIPNRRKESTSKVGLIDPAKHDVQKSFFAASSHYYKESFWQKLTFG